MIRSLLVLSLAAMMLSLTSCSEMTTSVSKSPDGQVVVYERRKSGAGPAPDSVRSFLAAAGTTLPSKAEPILEGQDVGRVCYTWTSPTELNLRISGGYIDRVARRWQGQDGLRVEIRYVGTPGCAWH